MLHTKIGKSRKLMTIRQFTHECVNCIGHMHASLCNNCPHLNTILGQKAITGEMTERIASALEQENTLKLNERINE